MSRKLRVVQGGGRLAKERARVAQIDKSVEAHFRQWHAETVELHARLRRSKAQSGLEHAEEEQRVLDERVSR